MPDRIGIIGSMQGVNASARPKPKKARMIAQKLPSPSSVTMRDSSETGAAVRSAVRNARPVPFDAPAVAAPSAATAPERSCASSSRRLCSCGG
jgi:hypothetical protein